MNTLNDEIRTYILNKFASALLVRGTLEIKEHLEILVGTKQKISNIFNRLNLIVKESINEN